MSSLKLNLENAILAIFFGFLLFISIGALWNHSLKHDFPYGYFASDAFQHQIRGEAIKDAGNFRHEAPYISLGFENIVGRYPPLLYHLAAIFSYAAGLEIYDAVYFIVFFFAIMAILAMHFIIKNFNRNVALISLPLSMLIFSHPNSIGFLWGHWPSVLAQSFLIPFFWFFARLDLERSYVFAGIIFSAVILAHTSEGIFGFMFVIIYFAVKLISKAFSKKEAKCIMASMAIAFLLSAWYLVIFKYTWGYGEIYQFLAEPLWNDNPGFYIMGFGFALLFILAGILLALYKFRAMHTAFIAGFSMLLSGFLNYAGFGLRSFQIRFFWPLYLSVFFGFGLYATARMIFKKMNYYHAIILFLLLIAPLAGFARMPYVPHYTAPDSRGGMMDPYHWNALKFLSEKTEQNSRIYFFYGDIYGQDALLRNSKRVHYQVNVQDFANSIKDRKIKRSYISKLPGDSGGGLKIRESLFEFKDATASLQVGYAMSPQDICKFNYFVFDKVSQQNVFAQYNMLIASEMLKKGSSKVFENEVAIILKNNKLGGDCIEERSF